MSGWKIIAAGPAQRIEDCAWQDAAGGAQAIAANEGARFDLLLIGDAGDGIDVSPWPAAGHVVALRGAGVEPVASHYAAVAAEYLRSLTQPACIVVPAGTFGDDMAVALAGALGAHVLGRPAGIELREEGVIATRPAFGGRVALSLLYPAESCVATMRGEKMAAPTGAPVTPEIVDVVIDLPGPLPVEQVAIADRKASLEGAGLVICGGRGLDAAGFGMLERLASGLGGVVGGSLPAVDAGFAPVSHQVGQSGKFVTPKLYLGVGVSGTPQHLAGIGTATAIAAINTDPDALIFRYAELGIVADAREFLPLLLDQAGAAPN